MSEDTNEFKSELPENWRDVLPEDMRGSGVLDTVKTIDSLAKMAIDGRNLANTALRIPSDDASDDDRKAFREDLMGKLPDLMFKPKEDNPDSFKEAMRALGMPEESKGYDMPELPDAIKANMEALTETAFEAGLTNDQFSKITEGILTDYKNSSDQMAGQLEQSKDALKQEWGSSYDQKVNSVAHFAKQTGFSEDFVTAVQDGKLDATNMKAFETVIAGFEGGGVEIGRQPNDISAVMPPAEAEAQINDIMSNKDHAYWNSGDPAHQQAVEKIVELGRLAESGRKETDTDKFRAALNA